MVDFTFWINPDAGQSYNLELNLQDDDNGDQLITDGIDDEFQFTCVVSPSGPCAVSGGGWQKITVPLTSFVDDNSFLNGGNGVLDADPNGNGQLVNIVIAIISTSGSNIGFRTDYWAFNGPLDDDEDGVANAIDNCLLVDNADQVDSNNDGYGNLCDADLNDDCVVNVADLGLLRQVFFTADSDADFNSDGVVNVLDLAILRNLFFAAPGPSGTTSTCSP